MVRNELKGDVVYIVSSQVVEVVGGELDVAPVSSQADLLVLVNIHGDVVSEGNILLFFAVAQVNGTRSLDLQGSSTSLFCGQRMGVFVDFCVAGAGSESLEPDRPQQRRARYRSRRCT